MKPITKILSFAITALILSGCETMDTFNQSMQQIASAATPPPPPAVTDTLQKICQESQKNEVRANTIYKGKSLSITATFQSVSQYTYGYLVYLESDNIGIFANAKDKNNILSLSDGQKVHVTGTISDITTWSGCKISIENPKFS